MLNTMSKNILGKVGIGFGKPVVLVTPEKRQKLQPERKQTEPQVEVSRIYETTTPTKNGESSDDIINTVLLASLISEIIPDTQSTTNEATYSSGVGGDFDGGGATGSWESDSPSDSSVSE